MGKKWKLLKAVVTHPGIIVNAVKEMRAEQKERIEQLQREITERENKYEGEKILAKNAISDKSRFEQLELKDQLWAIAMSINSLSDQINEINQDLTSGRWTGSFSKSLGEMVEEILNNTEDIKQSRI